MILIKKGGRDHKCLRKKKGRLALCLEPDNSEKWGLKISDHGD